LEARREGEGQDVADGDVELGQGADQDPCQYSPGVNTKELMPSAKDGPMILLKCSRNLIFNSGIHNINKTIRDEGITVDFGIIKVHTSN